MHLTQGDSRDHRPDLHQVMLELIVEHQAGIPVLMKPLSGNSRDAHEFGQAIRDHIEPLQSTDGTTYWVADSARYSEDNLRTLQDTHAKWIARVPATLKAAQTALAQAHPDTMAPFKTGSRYPALTSTYGDVAQRWRLIYSEPRRRQAQRTVSQRWLKQSEKEVQAFQKLCRRELAGEADARQALPTFEHGLHDTLWQDVSLRSTPRYDKPGRPKRGDTPKDLIYHIEGALASWLTAHEDRVVHESCFLWAPHERDEVA